MAWRSSSLPRDWRLPEARAWKDSTCAPGWSTESGPKRFGMWPWNEAAMKLPAFRSNLVQLRSMYRRQRTRMLPALPMLRFIRRSRPTRRPLCSSGRRFHKSHSRRTANISKNQAAESSRCFDGSDDLNNSAGAGTLVHVPAFARIGACVTRLFDGTGPIRISGQLSAFFLKFPFSFSSPQPLGWA